MLPSRIFTAVSGHLSFVHRVFYIFRVVFDQFRRIIRISLKPVLLRTNKHAQATKQAIKGARCVFNLVF